VPVVLHLKLFRKWHISVVHGAREVKILHKQQISSESYRPVFWSSTFRTHFPGSISLIRLCSYKILSCSLTVDSSVLSNLHNHTYW